MSPALADGFFATEPPGKSLYLLALKSAILLCDTHSLTVSVTFLYFNFSLSLLTKSFYHIVVKLAQKLRRMKEFFLLLPRSEEAGSKNSLNVGLWWWQYVWNSLREMMDGIYGGSKS